MEKQKPKICRFHNSDSRKNKQTFKQKKETNELNIYRDFSPKYFSRPVCKEVAWTLDLETFHWDTVLFSVHVLDILLFVLSTTSAKVDCFFQRDFCFCIFYKLRLQIPLSVIPKGQALRLSAAQSRITPDLSFSPSFEDFCTPGSRFEVSSSKSRDYLLLKNA